MRTLRILLTTGLIVVVSFILAGRPLGASAHSLQPHSFQSPQVKPLIGPDLTGYNYDIEAENHYCTGGGTYCAANAGIAPGDLFFDCVILNENCAGLNFAAAEIFGPPTGASYGTPINVYVECDNWTSSAVQYAIEDVVTSYSYDDLDDDLGVISGKGTLLDWSQLNPNFPSDNGEGNAAQPSSASVSLYDTSGVDYDGDSEGAVGGRATVTGIINTNNTDIPPLYDTLNSGSFRITITSTIHVEPYSGGSYSYWGTMSCEAGGPHAYDLYNAGYDTPDWNYFEGELEYHEIY